MFLLGTFVGQQFTNPSDHDDLDFFAFPAIDSKWGQDSLDAPIDGFMLSKGQQNNGRRQGAARRTSAALPPQNTYLATDPNDVGGEQARRHERTTARCRRRPPTLIACVEAHRAVHGPRHPAGLRLHRDDPVAAVLPQQPERRRLAGLEHREAEEGDLRQLSSTRHERGDRGSSTSTHEGRRAASEEARRPPLDLGPDRAGPDGRDPGR